MTMKAYPLFRYSNVLENIGVKASKNPTTDDSGSPSAFTVERTQRLCFRIKSRIPYLSLLDTRPYYATIHSIQRIRNGADDVSLWNKPRGY